MDSDRFDALARTLSKGATRRSLTRLLGGLALGGLLPSLAGAAKKGGHHKKRVHHTKDGHARKGGKGKDNGKQGRKDTDGHKQGNDRTVTASATANKCSRQGTTKCSNVSQCSSPDPCQTPACTAGCCALTPAPDGTVCGGGQVCQGGHCVTADVSCNDAGCSGGQACVDEVCACPSGTAQCGDYCVNTQIDPTHCGTCGVACDGGNGTCKNGVCATPEVCDGVDNDFDGAVDECPANQVCRQGSCACPEGTRDCDGDGRCESLDTDQYCGSCDTPCSSGQTCQGGACVCQPEDRWTTCFGEGWVCGEKMNNCGQSVDCGGCNRPGIYECRGGQCVPAPGVCFDDTGSDCPDDQVCDMRFLDWYDFGVCICGPSQDCSGGCTCAYGRECQGGQCVCVLTAYCSE